MKLQKIFCLSALAFLILGFAAASARAQSSAYRISAPYSYKNLTVFLIHGRDELKNKNILTLQEAMEKGILVVYETSDVNNLEVENISKTYEVFIQSGDIVKGGKQDRVLAVDIIIHARSGRISIEAFCVESGRWQKRGGENAAKFTSSNERIVTKDLKIAANKTRSQGEVWRKVEEAQSKLSRNVGASVNSAASRTSLQLSLENGKVVATAEEYVRKLSPVIAGKSDVIGYAFVINGKINSADVYASNALFEKLWLKLLKASAVEAVAELRQGERFEPVRPGEVKSFLENADRNGPTEERKVTSRVKSITREDKENIVFESRDEKQNVVLHRSYVKKH
jgi:hypothetical protein